MNKKKPLSSELIEEEQEEQFWDEVEEQAKWKIYEVLTANIPLQNVKLIEDNWGTGGVKKIDEISKKVGFFPDKDTDFRVIARDDIPSYLQEDEEFTEKIERGNWSSQEVDYVAQLIAFNYLVTVIKGIDRTLQAYDSYDSAYSEGLGD